MEKNIEIITKKGICMSCGVCSAICPEGAISMTLEKGVYIPKIDKKKCINCSKCLLVCPKNKSILKKTNNILAGNYIKCYSGFSVDKNLRFESSSGGVIPAILNFALQKKIIDGVLMVKSSKESPIINEYFIAKTKEDVYLGIGSKYGPVKLDEVLKKLKNLSGKFIFVGKPCDIEAMKKAEKIDRNLEGKIILYFGLFCNHTPNLFATRFLLDKLKIKNLDFLKYRGGGWPGFMTIVQKDKKIKVPISSYWNIIGSDYFTPEGCLTCSDHLSELADISFGDAWLPEFKNDKLGTSIIISRTEKGCDLLKKAKNAISISPLKIQRIISSQIIQLYLKKKIIKARTKLLKKDIVYENVLEPNIIDYIASGLLLINSKLPPIKMFFLYNKIVKHFCYRLAKIYFKKYEDINN
jgi:coenzyme F420 hydrogenase subunit beta